MFSSRYRVSRNATTTNANSASPQVSGEWAVTRLSPQTATQGALHLGFCTGLEADPGVVLTFGHATTAVTKSTIAP